MVRSVEKPRPPRVSPPDLPHDLEDVLGMRHGDHVGQRIALADGDLAHARFEQCVLHGAADHADLAGATLMDVSVREPQAPALVLRDASLRRVRIEGGRIGTLDLTDARIGELEIRDVRIDYLTFGGARVEDADVADSTIRALDMPLAMLSRVRFTGCRADEVDVRGLRATDVDLRGLDALSYLDVLSLKGTTMSSRQIELLAGVLAAATGIDVRD
ncbi:MULTISPECIES: pentapeptide repeat-containing protein [Bacteria]|uniref:pentapeptide repeat-containing protein n=1 Tax=Bacteria TaxID=2 RepID=UPI003C7AF5D8